MSLKNIPFTYHWILQHLAGNNIRTILDLGSGRGDIVSDLWRGEQMQIDGVEVHQPYIDILKRTDMYKQIYCADILKLPSPLLKKKYDLVFSSQVIEHLPKTLVLKNLTRWERLANKKVIYTTTNGFTEYDHDVETIEKNSHQKHLSAWYPKDFIKLGYTVRGQGLKIVFGEGGLVDRFGDNFLFSLLSYVFSPLVYFFPRFSTYLVIYKSLA